MHFTPTTNQQQKQTIKDMCKRFLCMLPLLWLLANSSRAQTNGNNTALDSAQDEKGINWTTGLSWEQVKQKAKKENKYIFLDCFATWCGPCKQMEKDVFTIKSLGDYYNNKFISVRVQIDKTKNDDDFVRSWYGDAESINKKYRIIAFPTFLYFKPDGSVVYKERGYQGPFKMVDIAKLATIPGRKYEDPYKKYDEFVETYNKGLRDYKQMPTMVDKAKEIGDGAMFATLTKEYFNHLNQSKKSEWYTKTNIKFIAAKIANSKSPFFAMFYPDGEKVNKIMGKNQYARYVVDRIINEEMISPFVESFLKRNTKKTILSGNEPSWDSMMNVIAAKYNNDFAARAIRSGKHKFYWTAQQQVSDSFMSSFVQIIKKRIEKNDMDPDDEYTDIWINEVSWIVFQKSTDETEIKMAIQWMKDLISRDNAYSKVGTQCYIWDTYANLLYKNFILFHNGQLSEAISWEKKALQAQVDKTGHSELDTDYINAIDKMNKRVPTWN